MLRNRDTFSLYVFSRRACYAMRTVLDEHGNSCIISTSRQAEKETVNTDKTPIKERLHTRGGGGA